MPEQKYILYNFENCFGKRSDKQFVKKGLGGYLGNRADAIKHYKKSEHKWRKLKDLKKQNKMIIRFANKYVSQREWNKIKRIRAKNSKKRRYSIRDSSIIDSDYDSSLYIDSHLA